MRGTELSFHDREVLEIDIRDSCAILQIPLMPLSLVKVIILCLIYFLQ